DRAGEGVREEGEGGAGDGGEGGTVRPRRRGQGRDRARRSLSARRPERRRAGGDRAGGDRRIGRHGTGRDGADHESGDGKGGRPGRREAGPGGGQAHPGVVSRAALSAGASWPSWPGASSWRSTCGPSCGEGGTCKRSYAGSPPFLKKTWQSRQSSRLACHAASTDTRRVRFPTLRILPAALVLIAFAG